MRYRLLVALACVGAFGLPAPSHAQDATTATPPPGGTVAPEVAPSDAPPPSLEEILADAPELVAAVRAALGAKAERVAAWASALAVLFSILVSVARRYGGAVFHNKQTPRLIVLVGGFLVFLASYVGAGWHGWEALAVAVGPPLAILVHEIAKLAKPSKWRDFALKATELMALRKGAPPAGPGA